MKKLLRTRRLLLGATGAVLLMALLGVGLATLVSAHGGDASLIHSCVQNLSPGTNVRIMDLFQTCRRFETAVDWNVSGPPGPAGPAGAGLVGLYTFITIGADGLPIISYYDETNKNLKVPHCSNSRCIPFVRPR